MVFAKVLRWGFVVVVAVTAVIVLLILSGVNDPKPIGALVGERPLFPQIIAPEAPRLTWLEEPVPTGNTTVRLTAAQEEGHGMDIGYGLILGDDDTHLAVAVSPLGYVSVWQQTIDETDVIFPWQPWPHVGRDSDPNEIWVDVDDLSPVDGWLNSHATLSVAPKRVVRSAGSSGNFALVVLGLMNL